MKITTHFNPSTNQTHAIITTDDRRYFVTDIKDGRNKTTGRQVGQMEHVGQYGEPLTTIPDALKGLRFIIVDKQTDSPLSVHQTLETVAEFLPKHQAKGHRVALLGYDDVAHTETSEIDISTTTRFRQVVQFNPATMTGQPALIRPDLKETIAFIEPKDKRTKSDSVLCRHISSTAFHVVPTTAADSPYRFALEDSATGHTLSLHTTIPNTVPFLQRHRDDGYTVRLTNAEGQAINV